MLHLRHTAWKTSAKREGEQEQMQVMTPERERERERECEAGEDCYETEKEKRRRRKDKDVEGGCSFFCKRHHRFSFGCLVSVFFGSIAHISVPKHPYP